MSTAVITLAEPWTGTYDERLPLERLDEKSGHIHARMEIHIAGRLLPHVGFSGPDDVCLDSWVYEFSQIAEKLRSARSAEHTYDEGEQGQPAFHFRRRGDKAYVSVVDSLIGGGAADSDFQEVECAADDVLRAIEGALDQIRELAFQKAGDAGRDWWADITVGTALEDEARSD